MRIWKGCVFKLIVLAVLGAPCLVRAAETSEPAPRARTEQAWTGIFSWLNPSPNPPPRKSPAVADSADPKKPSTPANDSAAKSGAGLVKNQVREASKERAREQAALFRRLDVCDQLRLIAMQKKDDTLLHQAEQLEARVWVIYTGRVNPSPAAHAASATEKLAIDKPPQAHEPDTDTAPNPTAKKSGRLPTWEEK